MKNVKIFIIIIGIMCTILGFALKKVLNLTDFWDVFLKGAGIILLATAFLWSIKKKIIFE